MSWCSDAPEDEAISLFPGLLANPDVRLSLTPTNLRRLEIQQLRPDRRPTRLWWPGYRNDIRPLMTHVSRRRNDNTWAPPHTWDLPPNKTTGVSERLSSSHPAATSDRCIWTQVHAGVVAICSDQPVCYRFVVFGFVARWKEGFVSMINRNFMRLLMMGVFSRVCSGVLWGMRESVVSDSGRRHWFFFG
jgi:hypothetical protein